MDMTSAMPPGSAGTRVLVQGLTKRFGLQQILRGVDIEFGLGVFGLLGPNGAGKTTLLRVLATVLQPTSGVIQLLGRDASNAQGYQSVRRRLGYLPQSFGYYPDFTLLEFVEYFALLKGVPPRQARPAATRAVGLVDLKSYVGAKLRTLSGGMLRRAGVAQAIVNEPDLLLLDEPTVGLDLEQRIAFRALLRQLGERSTVVVSTHLAEDISTACSEVALMDGGRIAFRGTPADLIAQGSGHPVGDSPLERGYSAVLARTRA